MHNYDDPLYIIKEWKDNNGTTILMWACYYNYYELAKLCLDLGVNKNYKNNLGSDAFYFASDTRNNFEIINLLNAN